MSSHDLKLLIIGLDGANRTTAQLVGLESDSIHDFISTIPPYTPPAWTSIFTGVNPAKHGIIGWQRVERNTLKTGLVTSHDVMYPRLSEILDRAGFKSVIVNLPMTYPFSGISSKENTVIVSDWAAPEQTVYPKRLLEKYKKYLIDPPHEWTRYLEDKRDYASLVRDYTETRLEMYYDLLENIDWNLFFIVFSETDWFSHIYPQILEEKDTNLVKPTFRLIMKFIEDAGSIADVVFIVSDHGFEVKNKVFYVNSALAKGGFIKYSSLKLKLAHFVSKVVPDSLLRRAVQTTNAPSNVLEATLKPEETKAFMPPEPTTWGIYITDDSLKEKVKEHLLKFEEIKDVIDSASLYSGPYLPNLPDLFIVPQKGVEYSYKLSNKLIENKYLSDHELHGIFSTFGEGISGDIEFTQSPRVYDIVPTVLHIFNLPIPDDIDGRVLMEIFEENSEFTKRKPKYSRYEKYKKGLEIKMLRGAIKKLKLKN